LLVTPVEVQTVAWAEAANVNVTAANKVVLPKDLMAIPQEWKCPMRHFGGLVGLANQSTIHAINKKRV
jgi:hypothetical protein